MAIETLEELEAATRVTIGVVETLSREVSDLGAFLSETLTMCELNRRLDAPVDVVAFVTRQLLVYTEHLATIKAAADALGTDNE